MSVSTPHGHCAGIIEDTELRNKSVVESNDVRTLFQPVSINWLKTLSDVRVTTDGVWIGDSIY
jgi:hypothetical protein